MNNRRNYYSISQLERLTNVAKRTILFYVEKGLLHQPLKTGKTMAYYDEAHVQKLLFIKTAKKKGLPLIAIQNIIATRESEGNGFGRRVNQNLKNETSDDIERRKPKKITGKITRERILGEGSRIFQEKGFRNTRVNDIINYLNIGKGSFYSYFSNKEELFLECAPLIFEKFFSEGLEKVKTEKDPFKRLSIRAEIVIPVIREFSTILRLSREAMKETDPNLKNLGEKIYRSICHPIEADIAKGIKQGTFRAVNPKIYSYFMIGIIEQIDDALTMNPDISSTSIKNAISDILTRILLASL